MVRENTLGVYRLHEPATAGALSALERELNAPVGLVSVYRAWGRCRLEDDAAWISWICAIPRPVMLTWEPWRLPGADAGAGTGQPAFALSRIAAGDHDGYIRAFLREVAARRENHLPILLRPMHEMNGNWYPWCVGVNSNTAAQYREAFIHISELAREVAPGRFELVFSPYCRDYGQADPDVVELCFPGAAHCGWLGVDGYNWGDCEEGGTEGRGWTEFGELFSPAYRRLTALAEDLPVIVAETACAPKKGGGHPASAKAEWIEAMFAALEGEFPRVRALVWFDEDKERDWRIASSADALAAFRRLAAGHFAQGGIGRAAGLR